MNRRRGLAPGQRERVFIKRLIARGETTAQIKDALVAQYGRYDP